MKRFKFITILLLIAVILFTSIPKAFAAVSIPDEFITDAEDRTVLNYIKYKSAQGTNEDYSLYAKKAKDGTWVYCIDLTKKYDGNKTYKKKEKMDVGINYIIKHKPNTGDKLKDFYIVQMTVYVYQDWISGKDDNLSYNFKRFISSVAQGVKKDVDDDTKEVCKAIFDLFMGAMDYRNNYVEKVGSIEVTTKDPTFTEQDGYYVSSKIHVTYANLNGDVNYTLVNATPNTQVLKDSTDGSYTVKVPVTDVPAGQKAVFSLKWDGAYSEEGLYYYYADSAHQRLMYEKFEVEDHKVSAQVQLSVYNEKRPVKISKTDVTQQKEIPGATLILKDANGNVVEEWVSTNESHNVTLNPGEYSLTETIAPDGYKLSTTTIYFKIDANGKLYEKVDDKYVAVEKINMINELEDHVTIVKKDKDTGKYVAGAVMVIKDSNGNVVQEFTSTNSVYELVLKAGEYTLEEKSAPEGYILSKEKLSFRVLDNGALQIKNSNGDYEDSVMIVFYNTAEPTPDVPGTGASGIIITVAGITLLISGVAYAIKTTKEC